MAKVANTGSACGNETAVELAETVDATDTAPGSASSQHSASTPDSPSPQPGAEVFFAIASEGASEEAPGESVVAPPQQE